MLFLRGGVAVAAKPNESPELAQQAMCEVAAYFLARELDFGRLVPTTVLRRVPGPGGGDIEGSAQVMWHQFVIAEQHFSHTDCPDDVAWKIAVFDLLAANTDRNSGNWGAITALPDAVLIDHGHCFTKGPATASPFFIDRHGQPLPDDVKPHVERFLASAANTRLQSVLDGPIVEGVWLSLPSCRDGHVGAPVVGSIKQPDQESTNGVSR